MENNKKLSVGDKVWILDRHSKTPEELKKATVSKIGRKYFEVEPSYFGRFH